MLDGLLGRGFSSKCKSLIKLTRTRLDVIKRKRNAMQKYLKKDIADLLANGLDINAYGRAEGLSIELNLSSCYDFVEQFCEFVPKHLSAMQKQRECPEDCKEAVSSLMFAAARFADLPELRDLRDMFTERYGKTLESFTNMEFVENLASKPPTAGKKLQLMRAIAQEFSIKWDSKAFEQKIANSPLPAQDRSQTQGSTKDCRTDENKQYNSRDGLVPKRDDQDVPSSGRRSDNGYMLHGNREKHTLDRASLSVPSHGRWGNDDDEYNNRDGLVPKRDNQDVPSSGRPSDNGYILHSNRGKHTLDRASLSVPSNRRVEIDDGGYRLQKEEGQTIPKKDDQDVLFHKKMEFSDNRYKQHKGRDETILQRDHTTPKREKHDVLSQQEYTADRFKLNKGRDEDVLKRDNMENSSHGRREEDKGQGREDMVGQRDKQKVSSYRAQDHPTVQQKMKMDRKEDPPFVGEEANSAAKGMRQLPPPPYVKPNGGKYTTRYAASDQANNKSPADLLHTDRSERAQTQLDRVDHDDKKAAGPARVNIPENVDHQDDLIGDKSPKPKSVRRRNLKPPAGQEHKDNKEGDGIVKRHHSNGRRREDSRRGLQHALEEDRHLKDEDDRMMDKLLVHYSKKPSKFESMKVREGLNAPPGHDEVADTAEPQRRRRKDNKPVPPPSRAASLPPEPVTPTEPDRVPARATSFQPEMLNPGPHVHPRLPDYDDLAARFAALRGR